MWKIFFRDGSIYLSIQVKICNEFLAAKNTIFLICWRKYCIWIAFNAASVKLSALKVFTHSLFSLFQNDRLDHETLIIGGRRRGGCRKPDANKGYVICEKLPFTEIKCGIKSDALYQKNYPVPNKFIFVWVGETFKMNFFYQYLAIRAAASIQRPEVIYFVHDENEEIGE